MEKKIYPFLVSVPHGGCGIPPELLPRLALEDEELCYYCDPCTRELYDFRGSVAAWIDTPVSRMAVDLNRPPLPLPPADPDGIIKATTIDGKPVYRAGMHPDAGTIHRVLVRHYFPYHQKIDELIDTRPVSIAFDCHSMLPYGSSGQKDAGLARPLVCLGNNGDREGNAKNGGLATCPAAVIRSLAEEFAREFPGNESVAINEPFSGGFISNAHFWRKGVPWVQIEMNRSLYEGADGEMPRRVALLRERIFSVLSRFWDQYGGGVSTGNR